MITGFKKGDLVVHPLMPHVCRLAGISGPYAFLEKQTGEYLGVCLLGTLQLTSELPQMFGQGGQAQNLQVDDIQVNDILLYRSLPDNEFAIKEVRVDRIIDNTFLLEGDGGRIYGCREPSNLKRAPIRAGDWVRVPDGPIWVTQERIEQDGLRVSGDFYPWAVVHRIARPVLQPQTWQGSYEPEEAERPLTRKASRIPFGEDAMHQLEELQGHFGAQKSSPSMIEATNKVESQIVAMRDRLARLRNMDAKLHYHLNGRIDSKLPWNLDGNTVSIYVSRDVDLEDFVSRYANFREVAPPEFLYVVQYAETGRP